MKYRNTKVFIRILPNIKNCWEDIKILQDRRKLYIRSLQDYNVNGFSENSSVPYWQFDTDGVFYNDSQIEIYQSVTEDIIERALFYGNNALVLAYGQTGTGKSLTISGLNASYQDRGILPRLITDVFHQREILKDTCRINVEISYVETCRNYLKDLFVLDGPTLEYNTIKNVTRTKVISEDEAMKLLFIADGRRAVAANNNNLNSHISNVVFTFHITCKSKRVQEKKLVSKIHVVDLMGADRYGYETCDFKSAYDVSTGNLSKSQLEQFFNVLSDNIPQKTAVFQHLNILIYYLRDTLSTENILRFIGHIRTTKNDIIISLSMLRFAHIIRGLKSAKRKVHSDRSEQVAVKKLQEDLLLLKKELELSSMLNNESLKVNITQERIEHIENVAEDYLRNKTNELFVLNVCDATTVMKVFKNLYNELQIERDELAGAADRLRRAQDDITKVASKRATDGMGFSNKTFGNRRAGSMKSAKSFDATSFKKPKAFKKSVGKGLSSTDYRTSDPSSSGTGHGAVANVTDGGGRTSRTSRTLHKSGSGNSAPNVPSGSKRRSSLLSEMTVKSTGQEGHSVSQPGTTLLQMDMDVHVPSTVPSFNDAWLSFLADTGTNAATLYDELQIYKDSAIDANRSYMAQVRLLNEYREMVEARQDDLLKAKMQSDLEHGISTTVKQEQESYQSPLELKCENLVKQADLQFLIQQEVVLKCQSELKVYVQQCNLTKKDINDKFNVFCKESYKTVVPPLPEPEKRMELDLRPREEVDGEPQEHIYEIEAALKTNTDDLLSKYEQLKQLRDREFEKRRITSLKNKKWIRSCKV